MRFHLIAVGRMKNGPEKTLFDHYAQRLRPALSVVEVEEKRPLTGSELQRREAELLLGTLPERAGVVALDERGKACSSRDFAGKLENYADRGLSDMAFIIGGADGLHEDVRKRADLLISFGSMTWPHMLVRGLLAEQLYRAISIQTGHPYHRD